MTDFVANQQVQAAEGPPLLDDCRLQLAADNVFRFCAGNGMPPIPEGTVENVRMQTAADIEAERLAKKKQ